MYSVSVEARFSAVHQVRLGDGTLEPPHEHDWLVRACFSRSELDEVGMVVDFSKARSALQSVLARLDHADLNSHEGLAGKNPTAEVVARYIFDRMAEPGLSVPRRIEVTEAPGCVAAYGPAGLDENAG